MKRSKLIFLLILIVALAAGVGIYTDVSKLMYQLVSFGWLWVVPALGLAFANYILRFAKWQYFLTHIKVAIPPRPSALVFFSGLAMSVTPGKVGELLKSYLLREMSKVPMATTFPVVIAERLTDLLALLVLAVFGVISSGYGVDIMVMAGLLCAAVVVLALWQRAGEMVIDALSRISFIGKRKESLLELQRSMLQLVGPGCLSVGTVISVVAWFAECLAFYLILQAAGVDFSLGNAVFVYSLGTIAGAVTMLPGGLVATEASMVFVLVEVFHAASRSEAVTSVLVVRICTLWFAVLVGVIALAWLKRLLGLRGPVGDRGTGE